MNTRLGQKMGSCRDASMKRRSFLAALSTLPLVSCLGESGKFRFKVIAKVLVDGQPMERSTVMEVRYARVTHSLIGLGGAARLSGEAIICDFGSRGTFFIIPRERSKSGSLIEIYEEGILTTFGIQGGVGGMNQAKTDILANATGRRPFNDFGHLPAFIAFGDESNPKSIFELDPFHLSDHFPGISFAGLDIEVTNEPITKKLIDRIPWLKIRDHIVFDRDPPGKMRADRDSPIGFVIQTTSFFGD